MKQILILGASGSLATTVIPELLQDGNVQLTLFTRRPQSVAKFESERVKIVQGDVLDLASLQQAMQGVNAVYAGLAGNLKAMAENIVKAMNNAQVKRLVWISSMGIYGETGEDHGAILEPYRQSAAVIETSKLDYTIVRPGWFTNDSKVQYQLTHKGEPFKGHSVSRKSIADFVAKILREYSEIRESVGIAA
ncbi:NAD-dependent epimerase/dehydratase [Mannheimia sp. USDA-ARS-USMARC-1261]|uniref:NAD(P)H-binding protein n=1 Tax=Mannheimia TaxID=75984 RepID=UPI0003E3F415|nr:NAD(P)H-binding protein [Mannheimia sp. USDA-ARS-USMARC-1261]AHG73415.1 NAD-dependent epimerase/dehydratase [Mannheimia sp. USDA-ARS-USMARC-1261]